MPMDPFFTSKVKDDFEEKKRKSVAYAKALQINKFLHSGINRKAKETTLKQLGTNPDVFVAKGLRGKISQADSLRPSTTGFKPPKRKWDKK